MFVKLFCQEKTFFLLTTRLFFADKRDRRDRDSDRTNHDRIDTNRRSSKLCNQSSDKRSGSDDRDRGGGSGVGGGGSGGGGAGGGDRERDRDRERERDRLTRIGDWSEHVSSSCKKYYYNCKTEVSQWEKPKEWLEKERYVVNADYSSQCYKCRLDYLPEIYLRNSIENFVKKNEIERGMIVFRDLVRYIRLLSLSF